MKDQFAGTDAGQHRPSRRTREPAQPTELLTARFRV
jgi:hypothetical protein